MAEDKKGSSRTYKVLHASGDAFVVIDEVEASSAETAIRHTVAATEHGEGRYVAVPDRSWTEINVRIETPAPRVILEELTAAAPQAKKPAAKPQEEIAPDSRKAGTGPPDDLLVGSDDQLAGGAYDTEAETRAQQRRQAASSS